MADTERAIHPETPETDRAAALIGHLSTLRTTEPMLADLLWRVLARIIDGVLVFVFVFATDLVALALAGRRVKDGELTVTVLDALPVALLYTAQAAALAMYELVGIGLFGQTFGHRLMKLKVTGLDGQRPGLARAARRFCASVVPFVLFVAIWALLWPRPVSLWPFLAVLCFPAVLAASAWKNNDQRGFHDRFAGTRVLMPR